MPIRLTFVVTSLPVGGAELMLWKLLSRIDRNAYDVSVFALSNGSQAMVDRFRSLDVPCHSLGMNGATTMPIAVAKLAGAFRKQRPDLVQGWLYHGNIAASLGRVLSGVQAPVLWNIRGTLAAEEKPLTKLVIRASGSLRSLPAKIIYNSIASAAEHESRLGYAANKRVILPNGFDTVAFCPSATARAVLRQELGLPPDAFVIGYVGRYHPVKGHDCFLRAAALLAGKQPLTYYVLAGEDVDDKNVELRKLVEELGLRERVRLLGVRADMPFVTAALDISALASTAEGFPNAVGEAMSCRVPCVVSDVGDSAWVIGDTGRSVPPRDPAALAAALDELTSMDPCQRRSLGQRARERIIENFSLDAVVRRYEALYANVHAARDRT